MKLKILKICTSRSWGGMELNVALTCEKLRQRGHEVFPVCHSGSPIAKRLIQAGFKPFSLNLKSYFHPLKIFQLARYIQSTNIDLIHSDYARDLWTIVPAMKLVQRKPLVLLKHIGTQKPKNDFLHRFLYRHVDFIIAISNVIRKNVIETHPISPEKVGVIYHGVDFQRFTSTPALREKTRTELGLRKEELLIGIIGRLQISKGYLEFLHMAHQISQRYPQARFILVGEATRGEEKEGESILAWIDKLKLQQKVILTGFREDIPALLSAMDLFIFPSYAEAFGLVLIEAMSMKLPVVSSNCDGILDIVVHMETGLLIPPKNSEELTKTVEYLLDHEQQRLAMGEAGFRRAKEKFDEDKMFVQLEALYENLIRGKH